MTTMEIKRLLRSQYGIEIIKRDRSGRYFAGRFTDKDTGPVEIWDETPTWESDDEARAAISKRRE